MFDTDQYTRFFSQGQEAMRQGQEAVRFSVDTWSRLLRTVAGQAPALAPQFDAEAAVDQFFDVTESLLQVQREVAKRLLAAGTGFTA